MRESRSSKMYLSLCHPSDIRDLSAETWPSNCNIYRRSYSYGDYIEHVWDKLLEHVKSRMMGGSAEKCKHGEMLPTTIHAIICGPSNCGKTIVLINLLESPNGVSRTCMSTRNRCKISIPKYQYLENLCMFIDEIDYFTFSNNSDVVLTERGTSKLYFYLWRHGIHWENTFRRTATRSLIPSISVRHTRGYLNIWHATTCWFCSNRIVPTGNTFTTITWIPTCRRRILRVVSWLLAKKS